MEDSIEIPTEDSTVEITEEVELKPADEASSDLCSWKDKTVRQLKKAERQQLIDGFNSGKEDDYFKVMRMKNGQMRITKRTNPLTESAESAHEVASKKIEKQFQAKRLTDNQLLFEHIIDLEKRMVEMRFKHKKLKKRYNKLEQDIFDDSDDSEPEQSAVNEVDSIAEQIPEQTQSARIQPELNLRNPRPVKRSWRTMISSM